MSCQTQRILVQRSIAAPAEVVWQTLKAQQRLVSEVEDLRDIEIVESDQNLNNPCVKRLVRWRVWLKGFELEWREAQELDPKRRRVDFRQTTGMLGTFEGFWQVNPRGDQAAVELNVMLSSGMPHLGEFIDPVIVKAYDEFSTRLLDGLERLSIAARGES